MSGVLAKRRTLTWKPFFSSKPLACIMSRVLMPPSSVAALTVGVAVSVGLLGLLLMHPAVRTTRPTMSNANNFLIQPPPSFIRTSAIAESVRINPIGMLRLKAFGTFSRLLLAR